MGDKKYRDQDHAVRKAQQAIIFGGRCRCGQTDPATFVYHHVHGGGTAERKATRKQSGRSILDLCWEQGRPADGIEMLCADCHAKERSDRVYQMHLTAVRARNILGGMGDTEFSQLVENGVLPIARWEGSEPLFAARSVFDYAISSDTLTARIKEGILNNPPDEARRERGRGNCPAAKKKLS